MNPHQTTPAPVLNAQTARCAHTDQAPVVSAKNTGLHLSPAVASPIDRTRQHWHPLRPRWQWGDFRHVSMAVSPDRPSGGERVASSGLHRPDPAWLGPVPRRWAPWHCPDAVWALDAALNAVVAEPISLDRSPDGTQRAQTLGLRVLERSPQGRWRVWVCSAAVPGGPSWIPGSLTREAMWTMDEPLRWLAVCRQTWLQALMEQHRCTVTGQALPGQLEPHCAAEAFQTWATAQSAYARWVFDQWMASHWTDDLRQHLVQAEREAMSCCFDLDPAWVDAARRLHGCPQRLMRVAHWVAWDRHRALDARFLTDAPQLIQLRRWLDAELVPQRERLQVLHDTLHAEGIQPSMWRLLLREGDAWMGAFMGYFPQGEHPGLSEVAQVLIVAQAFGTRRLIHEPLMHALMSLACNPNSPHPNPAWVLKDLFPLAARMGVWWSQGDQHQRAEMVDWSHEVFAWGDKEWSRLDQRARRHLTWRGARRRVVHWLEEERLQGHRLGDFGPRWHLPIRDPAGATWEVQVLNTSQSIWEEARAMRHCAFRYEPECAQGAAVMVSLRERGSGQRVATALYRLEADEEGERCVTLDQASGWANSALSAKVQQVLHGVARELAAVLVAADRAEQSDRVKAGEPVAVG